MKIEGEYFAFKGLIAMVLVFAAVVFFASCREIPRFAITKAQKECQDDTLPLYCIEGVAMLESTIKNNGSFDRNIELSAITGCENLHYEDMTDETEACKRGVSHLADALYRLEALRENSGQEPILVP